MPIVFPVAPPDAEIRFLEYRLAVITAWPPSARKEVTLEAVSRRLASIARSTVDRGLLHSDVLALSCSLLDGVFYAGGENRESFIGRSRGSPLPAARG